MGNPNEQRRTINRGDAFDSGRSRLHGMIVYHLRRSSEIAELLANGLVRATGRQFMFDRWQDAALLLSGLYRQSADETDPYVALVIDSDDDMVVQSAIPERRLPNSLRADDIRQLQEHSYYADVDISAHRILDVKNGFGDSILARYGSDGPRRAPIWRFLQYAKPYWPFVLGATLCGLVKFLAPLFFPWMLKVLLDDVVLNTHLDPTAREQTMRHLVLAVLGVNIVWMFATYYRSILAAIAGHRLIRDLRVALFSHVQRLSHDFFARHQTGAISSRVVNDISLAQNFVGSALTNVWMDAVLLLALIAILVSIHPMMALISMSLMPIYIVALRAMGPRIRRSSQEVQQRLEVLSGELHERVAGVAILKGFTRESAETTRFAAQSNKLLRRVMHSVQFTAGNEVAVGFVVQTAPIIVVWYGAHEILGGRLTVGALTQFLLYLGMFYSPLQRLSDLSVVLSNALAAIDRIFEYFDTQPRVAEVAKPKKLVHCEGRIEFANVSFGYDANLRTLSDITLTILPGQTVAFVGPSGAGKSTMASLIPRFYDPTAGAIKVDGVDLREYSLESLRSHVGIVNQETILFSGTVLENMLLAAPHATHEQIIAALEAAHALEFVQTLPDGLGTEVGERGAVLSGGQKQRLAIARAFLKDPKILILDEATSALDSRSERRIQVATAKLLKNRTSIVIAHRLSTILRADQIVVLEGGRIADIGKHQELLARGGLYAQLYHEQFGAPNLSRSA
jgi:ABC-type multidrug transport system fused ATPase/permease subunit